MVLKQIGYIGLYEYRFENETRARIVECFETKVKGRFLNWICLGHLDSHYMLAPCIVFVYTLLSI